MSTPDHDPRVEACRQYMSLLEQIIDTMLKATNLPIEQREQYDRLMGEVAALMQRAPGVIDVMFKLGVRPIRPVPEPNAPGSEKVN